MDLYPESKVVPQSGSLVPSLDTTAVAEKSRWLVATSVRG